MGCFGKTPGVSYGLRDQPTLGRNPLVVLNSAWVWWHEKWWAAQAEPTSGRAEESCAKMQVSIKI